MKSRLAAAVVLLFAVVAVPEALAAGDSSVEDESVASADDSEAQTTSNNVTLTLSTLNLAKPVLSDETIDIGPEFEVMGEFNVADTFGVAGLLGYGPATGHNLGEPYDIHLFRVGLQGAWYPVDDFDEGIQLGVQGLHRRGTVDDEVGNVNVAATVNAYDIAPFIGYKIGTDVGFTFLFQVGGGVQILAGEGEAESGGQEATSEDSEIAPAILFNLNLGWSF